MPELPQLEMGLVPAAQRYVSKKWQDCNWVQSLEGGIDTAHFSFLHAVLTKDEKEALAIYSQLGGARRPVEARRSRALDPQRSAAEVQHPGPRRRPGDRRRAQDRRGRSLLAHRPVPDAQPRLRAGGDAGRGLLRPGLGAGDDTNCWIYTYSWRPDRPFTNSERTQFDGGFGVHCRGRRRLRAAAQHRQRLPDRPRRSRRRTSFTGITGVSEQDSAIQDSQGPIQDRTREHLGPTDLGIVEFRKLVMGAARALQTGRASRRRQQAAKQICRALGRLGRRAGQGSRRGDDRAFRPSGTAMSAHEYGLGE